MTLGKYDINVGDYLMADGNCSVYHKVISINRDEIYTKVYNFNHEGMVDNYDICNSKTCKTCYNDEYKIYTMEQILKILVFK